MRTTVLLTVLGAFSMTMLLAVLARRLGAHETSGRRVRDDGHASGGDPFFLAAHDGSDASDAGAGDCADSGSDGGSDGGCDGGGSD